MTHRSSARRRIAVGVAAIGIVAGLIVTTPSDASAPTSTAAVGTWSLQMQATVGGVQEALIGTMKLEHGTTCSIVVRANFAGDGHSHEAATCTWGAPAGPGADGTIRATGIAGSFRTEISFVVADGGKRLLLLLDGFPDSAPNTAPGVVGHGEAFRR